MAFPLPAPVLHLQQAAARKAAGDLDGALSELQRGLELVPAWPEALLNLGNLQLARSEIAAALEAYHKGLELRPDWPQAWNALGTALRIAGDLEGSAAAHGKAIDLAPDWAVAHHNRAVALQRLDREAEAEAGLRRAIELAPDSAASRVALAQLLLKRGDFAAGWREFEWRFQMSETRRSARPQSVWQGEPLNGRILLVSAEQGSGAQIQFVRFASRLADLGGRIWMEAPPNLARLFVTCAGVERIVALDDPCPEADFQVPLLSVPRLLGITLSNIPAEIPFLSAPEEPRPDLDALFASYRKDLKVGIAWNGNPLHPLNPDRSCSPACFSALVDLPGVRLFSLQYGEAPGESGIVSLAESLGDFASTAAVMERLDLIVTVDTCTAHLAGALGRPVWTLLHTPCDWRWMTGRNDSPWYPGMRLIRQERPGDWAGVFRQVREELGQR